MGTQVYGTQHFVERKLGRIGGRCGRGEEFVDGRVDGHGSAGAC